MAARDLTVVIPTFNERSNVEELVSRVENVLQGIDYELLFVDDDSSDETAELVFDLSRTNPRVRCLKRIGRRGLSSACIEGICASAADFVAVMDADLQHDETRLRPMYDALREDPQLDLAIGTRFGGGGSTGELSNSRVRMSRLATVLGSKLLGVQTSDPMSGFFMLRRPFFYEVAHDLSGMGFKILLDILASAKRDVNFVEIPYEMRARQHGASKLDTVVMWHYAVLLGEKTIGRFIPVRFILFLCIGLVGSVIHLSVLGTSMKVFGSSFVTGQSLAVVTAMTVNFFFNNTFTYRDRRLRGAAIVRGLLVFYAACSAGAFINLIVATYLYERGLPWYVAGLLGAAVGAIWNYSLTYHYAWGRGRPGATSAS